MLKKKSKISSGMSHRLFDNNNGLLAHPTRDINTVNLTIKLATMTSAQVVETLY